MKGISIFAFTVLAMSSSAFAETYSCNVLKDTHGHALLGAPAYSVQIDGQDVVLQVTNGGDEGQTLKTTDFKMELVKREVEAAVYQAQGIDATLVTGITGIPSVSISEKQGFEQYSADCSLIQTLPAQDVWHSGNLNELTITGNSAVIQFPCGSITIAKGWNTSGLSMDGVSRGGPVVFGQGTPVTVTATEKEGKIYVRTNEQGSVANYTFVRGKAEHTGLVCE